MYRIVSWVGIGYSRRCGACAEASLLQRFERLSTWAGRELSSTFLLDFPSVQEAAAELEKQKAKEGKHASALEVICQAQIRYCWTRAVGNAA